MSLHNMFMIALPCILFKIQYDALKPYVKRLRALQIVVAFSTGSLLIL